MRIAIIPARGGSKRIPGKNIKEFFGRPIISYSIDAALSSNLFDRVIVSTDSLDILAVAKQAGAEVPFMRPADIANDSASTFDVIQHAIQWHQDQGEIINEICCLYPTAPFTRPSDLQAGYQLLKDDSDIDYVFSATEYQYPIFRSFRVTKNDRVEMFWPENFKKRSQDLEVAFHDAGMFYFGRTKAFMKNKPIFSEYAKPYILPHYRVQDIDTPDDWYRAEKYYQLLLEAEE